MGHPLNYRSVTVYAATKRMFDFIRSREMEDSIDLELFLSYLDEAGAHLVSPGEIIPDEHQLTCVEAAIARYMGSNDF